MGICFQQEKRTRSSFGKKISNLLLIQKIMTKLQWRRTFSPANQDRDQFIVLGNQRRVGIDIHHIQRESVFRTQSLQGILHLLAQMAI